MNKSKCVEYYLDSRKYGEKEIQETIEKTKKQYLNKEVYVNVVLNKYGVYVLTFHFENKNNFINKIKFKITQIMKKPLLLTESSLNVRNKNNNKRVKKQKARAYNYKGYNSNRKYGQYKETKEYKPF